MLGSSSIRIVVRSRNRIRPPVDFSSHPPRPILFGAGHHERTISSRSSPALGAQLGGLLTEPTPLLAATGSFLARCRHHRRGTALLGTTRCFNSEGEYHRVADDTLHSIQDAIDEAFERYDENNDDEGGTATAPPPEYELTLASGVLTLTLPGRGTWVLNKQTPNQQIWWSSPLSGPKRFEFLEGAWCSTKDGLTLGPLLSQELRHVHPRLDIDLSNL